MDGMNFEIIILLLLIFVWICFVERVIRLDLSLSYYGLWKFEILI